MHPARRPATAPRPTAPDTQICEGFVLMGIKPTLAPNGSYLEPSLSMPRLTRTSAALTWS